MNESRYGASPDIVHYKSLLNEEPIVNESQNNQNEIEDQINMFSSQAMQNQNTAKIVQFYESIIFKMSEEMQKLLINKCKIIYIRFLHESLIHDYFRGRTKMRTIRESNWRT